MEAAKCRAVCKDWEAYTDAWLRSVGPSLDLSKAANDSDPYLITSTLQATAAGCPKVWHLSVRGCSGVTPSALSAVAEGCPALTHLDLARSDVNDEALIAFLHAGGVERLKELDVTGCTKITDASVAAAAARCIKLTTLIATECTAVTDTVLTDLVAAAEDLAEVRVDLSAVRRDEMEKVAAASGGKHAVDVCSFDCDDDAAPMCCLVLAEELDGACM